ncbi:hypothetical protein A8C75_06765 [Marinobacterium aestuarii]|uniref:CRISPR-associated protein Cas6 C-terminal domain-containing protein n=1 Tax=Marinobacterium aestuarii TaxID=1821621 RepID=A0A1A9EWN1_9GAMM|nr:hypothetical protein [Marinobacterium aestuarii]ANG62222.1 hypothetical protein A8C75_06765 [Marinobacterium aestuarii]
MNSGEFCTTFIAGPAITTLLFHAYPERSFFLPAHPGSMLRGALGHALLSRFCNCGTSGHRSECFYVHLFEGYRRANQDGIPAVMFTPIDQDRHLRAGQHFRFRLNLIGLSKALQTAVQSAMTTALLKGLGESDIPCRLQQVTPITQQILLSGAATTLELVTPWLIKRRGRPLQADEFRVHDLLVALAQRQRMVNRHFELDLPVPDNKDLLTLADQLTVTSQLQDVCWQRHSQRQASRHPLQGVMGQLRIQHPNPEGLLPLGQLLANGTALHGGGKTSFGLGALQLTAPASTQHNFNTVTGTAL